MSCVIIYPGLPLPAASSNPPERRRAAAFSLFGLASDGVYMCPPRYRDGGGLLHRLSTLTCRYLTGPRTRRIRKLCLQAVYFCCTFPGVASAGRYPASCPVKPGLSSPGPFRSCQPRSHTLLAILSCSIRAAVIAAGGAVLFQITRNDSRYAAPATFRSGNLLLK